MTTVEMAFVWIMAFVFGALGGVIASRRALARRDALTRLPRL